MENPNRVFLEDDERISALDLPRPEWERAIQMKVRWDVFSTISFTVDGEGYEIDVFDINFSQ